MHSPSNRAFNWPEDSALIEKIVSSSKETLKILLKTKNEVHFLERWLQHHIPIIGNGRIIILDHMSTAPAVFKIYEKYADHLLLIRFGYKNPDFAHSMSVFENLYMALRESSNFIALLDTDEFLYFYDGSVLLNNNACIKYLERNSSVACFGTYWLPNVLLSKNSFLFKNDQKEIANYLYNGKVILNSSCIISKCKVISHAFSMPEQLLYDSPCPFVLLHCCRESMKQRIKVNMDKLVALGALENTSQIDFVLTLDENSVCPAATPIVLEMKMLMQPELMRKQAEEEKQSGYFSIHGHGGLTFEPEDLKSVFKKYVSHTTKYREVISGKR